MSLKDAARYLAAHGRGADTTLMHVAPDEVARLQRAAQERGGSLTINPHTGLPEANIFSKLNPLKSDSAISKSGFAPLLEAAALNYFAPGFGEALGLTGAGGLGLSNAAATGAVVGGVNALASGSLQKGLMAGLSAYGGTALGEAAMGGINNASSAAAQKIAAESAASGLDAGGAEMTKAMTAAQEAGANQTIADKIKAGAKGIAALGPKDLILKGLAATAPILASQSNKNKDDMPSLGSSTPGGYIHQYYYDPKSHSAKPLEPVRTQDWGNTTFESRVPYIPSSARGGLQTSYAMGGITDDGMAGGGPMMGSGSAFDFQQHSEPVVRMADGGLTPEIAKELMQRSMTTGVPNSEIAKYGGYDAIKSMYDAGGGQYSLSSIAPSDLQNYANTIANTGVGNLSALTQTGIGLTPAGIANMQANGTSSGGGSSFGLTPAIAKDIMQRSMTTGVSNSEIAKYGGYDAIKAMYDASGGQYSLESINPSDLQNYANTIAQTGVGNLSALTQTGISLTPAAIENMRRNGINPDDYLSYLKSTTPITKPATQTATTNPYGNKNTPGDLTANPNGTLTVTPNIPDRPYGGTTGMSKLISDYTAGGGHLGQVLSPKKAYENTGASADVYKYLMGQGNYPTQETGIGKNSRYYWGVEPTTSNPGNKYRINPQTHLIEPNPDYVAPAANGGLMQTYASGGTTSQDASINKDDKTATDIVEIPASQGHYEFNQKTGEVKWVSTPTKGAGDVSGKTQAKINNFFDNMTPQQKAEHEAQLQNISELMTPTIVKMMYDVLPALKPKDPNEPPAPVVDMSTFSPAALAEMGGLDGTTGEPAGTVTVGALSPAEGDANGATGIGDSVGTVGGIGLGGGIGSVGGNAGIGMGATASGLGTGIGSGAASGAGLAHGGLSSAYNLGSYSDGGRLLRGPGDGVSDSIPATIGKGQPARLADGEFVIPARIVSEIGNGSTEAGARKLYAMMDRIQSARGKTVGKGKVAVNTKADKYLPR